MSDNSHLRIALAQTCPLCAEPGPSASPHPFAVLEANMIDARDWVERASKEGADIVVFPEYFLQGLVNNERQYLTYPSRYLNTYLSSLAKEHNISIVGTIVHSCWSDAPDTRSDSDARPPSSSPFTHLSARSDSPRNPKDEEVIAEWEKFVAQFPGTNHGPRLENTAFYIEGGTGEVVDEFVKRNLWHPEREYLVPGEKDHQVFDTKWGRCGFLICWDVSHPSSGQTLSDLGADIVFAPTYWIGYDSSPTIDPHHPNPPQYETELVAALSYARAFETETVWVMCNAGGPAEKGYIGGSGVWMPLKGKVGGCEGVTPGMSVVDVDLGVLKDARSLYKIRTDWSERLER